MRDIAARHRHAVALLSFLMCTPPNSYDGKAFETLFKWAVTDPMNAERVTPAYKESIKPLLDLNKHLRAKL